MPDISLEPAVPVEWRIGDVILDLYEVRDLLGTSALGSVHRVHHHAWGLDLAVRSPRPEMASRAEAWQPFIGAIEAWAGLGVHTHIVGCHYVRMLGGTPRAFTECVDAGSLADWMQTGRLYRGSSSDALARVIDIAIQTAWGLDFAHEHDVRHHDVRPGNVLLNEDGVAKLTDFGLACAAGGADAAAHARAEDIRAWGATVFGMLKGEPPPAGSALADVMSAVLDPSLEPPRGSLGQIADTLRTAFESITSRPYPRLRPEARDLAAATLNNRALALIDLGRAGESAALWAEALQREPAHLESLVNRGLMALRAGVPDHIVMADLTALQASLPDPSHATFALGLLHLERRDPDAAEPWLKDVRTPHLRAKAAALVATHRLSEGPQPLAHHQVRDQNFYERHAALSADGQRVVSVEGTRVVVRDAANLATEIAAVPVDAGARAIALTPDAGEALVATDSGALHLCDLGARTNRTLQPANPAPHTGGHHGMVDVMRHMLEAASRAAFVSVAISAATRHALTARLTPGVAGHHGAVVVKPTVDLQLWDLDRGTPHTIAAGPDVEDQVSMSADGARALTIKERGVGRIDPAKTRIWDLQQPTAAAAREFLHKGEALEGRVAMAGPLAFIVPDNELVPVLLVDCRTGAILWERMHTPPTTYCQGVAMSLDGRRGLVAYISAGYNQKFDGALELWDLRAGRPLCTIPVESEARSVSLSADGSRALTFHRNGWLLLWQLPIARPVPLMVCRPGGTSA